MKKISLTLATLAVAASAFAQTPAQPQAPARPRNDGRGVG